MWNLTAFVETFVGTSVDTLVGRFVGTFVGSPWRAKKGKWTFVGTLVGTLVGALVGVFVGPLVGSNFAVRVLCACLSGRQKRDNTSAVKMLHQMSVWVVVVALGLMLNYRLSINSRRLKNGNGNYCLTGKLFPNNKKTAGNNLWSNSTNS